MVCRLKLKMLTSIWVADHIDMIVFVDRGCNFMSQPWKVQNSLMYSKPGSPIFIRAIDRLFRHPEKQYYGISLSVRRGRIVLAMRLPLKNRL